ncbi:MAG TPA: glycosyl hydrolase family 18 protein, partial [Gemmatimonadales bacterium]|nr:glycosyl hydrolase family 18 protein [Gemmatimonadales bacterium]
MKRRIFVIAVLTAVITGAVSVPVGVLAAGPTSPTPSTSVVPPLRGDGPVTLPNGKVLPIKPAWVQESSVQAQMLAEHGNDRPAFAPGGRPQPIGRNVASLSTAPGPDTTVYSLGLATPGAAFATLAATTLPNGMRKEVFGFLPYWMLSDAELQWMQYQLVTTIAYFGVAARSDGSLATSSGGAPTAGWSGWNSSAMTNVTNAAHARGVRVVLTITMMAWDGGAEQAALLGNAGARAVLINNIVAAVRDRNADGVNLDFEPVFTPQRDQYTSFVRQLKAGLVAAGAGSYLTVDTTAGAATWSTGYDVAALTADGAADALFVMGYDYSWSGSSRAGGVAPLESPYILDVTDSVDDFLSLMPGSKIIWGVPYYGRTWQT